MDGLWATCHGRLGCDFASIQELRRLIGEIYEDADERISLDSAAVGRIVSKFVVGQRKHTRSGNGFWLTKDSRSRIHDLVKKYGLALPGAALADCLEGPCEFCESTALESRDPQMADALGDSEGDPELALGETGTYQEVPQNNRLQSRVNDVNNVKVKRCGFRRWCSAFRFDRDECSARPYQLEDSVHRGELLAFSTGLGDAHQVRAARASASLSPARRIGER